MIHLETRWKAAAPSPLGEPDEENNGDVEIDAAAGSDADDPLCDECDEGEEESDGSEDGDVSLNDGVAASQDCKVAPSNDGDVSAGQVCKVASPDNEDEAGSESDHGTRPFAWAARIGVIDLPFLASLRQTMSLVRHSLAILDQRGARWFRCAWPSCSTSQTIIPKCLRAFGIRKITV